jgi:hypothetical protein
MGTAPPQSRRNDLDAAYAHLQANGVAAQKPSTAPYGVRQLYSNPKDVARCIVALRHPATYWTTGSILREDGGESIVG